MDFLNNSYYNNELHYKFCNDNNDTLNKLNSLTTNSTFKCLIEKSKNNIKCNEIIKEFKKKKEEFLSTNPQIISKYKYEITYNDDLSNKKTKYKEIEFNNYNEKYNNKIYINEHNTINIHNIQQFIEINDAFLKSLSSDEIKTLQYYTYKGDIFLNKYISTFTFDIDDNKKHAQIDDKHMFYSEDLEDYLFKIQMLNIFKDNHVIIDKITDKTLNNTDLYEDDYINILKLYIIDMNNIFKKVPKIHKDFYLYRGIEINYIYDTIMRDVDKKYNNKYFLSTSLFVENAYKYTKNKNRIICRFKIDSTIPLIFVEGISLAKNDMEVIIPNNTILTLSDTIINKYLYKPDNNFAKNVICPREYSDYDIIDVIDLNITSI